MTDNELERFKIDINLSEFAASRGYALDRRESSRNCAVMRNPNGDKIAVALLDRPNEGKPPAWYYFCVRDGRDNGSIIDFLQARGGGNLGEVRKVLRGWLGVSRPVVQPSLFARELVPVSKDRAGVIEAWSKAKAFASLAYLTGRGLGPDVLALPRFAGRVRVDARHNALFPHYDQEGLCGFEIKNQSFTGFASGGVKGLWHSAIKPGDFWLVLTEAAIDAISFHVMHGGDAVRYMSTGGTLNPQQPALMRAAMEKMPEGSVIVLAFDNDEDGGKLADEVKALAPAGRKVRRMVPDVGQGKDWNEALKIRLGLN